MGLMLSLVSVFSQCEQHALVSHFRRGELGLDLMYVNLNPSCNFLKMFSLRTAGHCLAVADLGCGVVQNWT